ncbi:hypothetical protein TCAL_02190 [Tigriopus californicus]|uniref:Mediator of RNA polymerase II transcription subunit 28 n=1 Tax=Tigriopus californicus TaxID=6832 RepID=A0A553NSK2_TIGCA|nr:mediator of RNA polymerase II transcription subunit 28-like [Tigriopus californicus]TRY68414.1 hypothetical protein TCAL_02190 [Tigriopus californicus]|eukprot:TCALIF_02190-PA protein Name:"Similar to MED28 Mediator of RNA polymerase II transcription subunit 28 (Aedes aegypti)" AED:0.18 eAED:0.18 QI:263/1/1/1/0/0/2/866/283
MAHHDNGTAGSGAAATAASFTRNPLVSGSTSATPAGAPVVSTSSSASAPTLATAVPAVPAPAPLSAPLASSTLVGQFESGFASILSALTQEEDSAKTDQDTPRASGDALKADQEEKMSHFMELARSLESFFLQKRMLIHSHKPELILKEESADMKQEMAKKDELIRRHYDKLTQWQALLQDMQGNNTGSTANPTGSNALGPNGPAGAAATGAPSLPGGPRGPSSLLPPTGPGAPIQPGVGAPQGGFVPGNNYRMQAVPMGAHGDHLSYLEKTTTNVGAPSMSR